MPAGIYTLCAQDVNLCQICVQDTVFEDPTGLNVMLSDNLAFEIYPNPSGNTSHLRIVGSLSKHKLQLVIVDLTGRLIQSYEIDKSRDIELNIGSGKGMFFVGLVEKNKTTPAIWQKWFVLE
ncbi:MAG: T9SS type A sorting domain-containing protein [Bacteroidetes bacterium]|nr:T9SS type A sorting domain-containing protein [Bacteroidota bacterium]